MLDRFARNTEALARIGLACKDSVVFSYLVINAFRGGTTPGRQGLFPSARERIDAMAKKKKKAAAAFALFDVVYEDGTLASNRRVPDDVLDDLYDENPAHTFLEAQDRKIAEQSGVPKSRIKSVTRVKPAKA